MIKIISEPVSVCGIRYVDVEKDGQICTMLESRTKLLNALYGANLNEISVNAIMSLVSDFVRDERREDELE